MDLGPLLNAHAYLRVERPPELWEADVDDVALVRALGEMIVAALVRGTVLTDVVLSIIGRGDWRPEILWRREARGGADPPQLVNADLAAAARVAGIPFAYTRSTGDGGSLTVFLPRHR